MKDEEGEGELEDLLAVKRRMSLVVACSGSIWTKEQDKEFENALAIYSGDSGDRWEKIAAAVTGKTVTEIKHHYELLVEDVNAIESDRVPLPCYFSSVKGSKKHAGNVAIYQGGSQRKMQIDSDDGRNSLRSNREKHKGIAWSEEEHRLFLLGLEKYGKGDWKSISKNTVLSRTPTQVASHAQKYFIRLNSGNKERRRSSIHDITTVEDGNTSALRSSNVGSINGTAAGSSSIAWKSVPSTAPGVFHYPPPNVHMNHVQTSVQQGLITGKVNGTSAAGPSISTGISPQLCASGVGVYAPTTSAVGPSIRTGIPPQLCASGVGVYAPTTSAVGPSIRTGISPQLCAPGLGVYAPTTISYPLQRPIFPVLGTPGTLPFP
ncbi:hypothetical protein RJ639_042276, partial [Escallonia herrerae]